MDYVLVGEHHKERQPEGEVSYSSLKMGLREWLRTPGIDIIMLIVDGNTHSLESSSGDEVDPSFDIS